MVLGRVVGLVWATRKDPRLAQTKLVVVAPHAWYEPPHEVGHLVAVDTLDAGLFEDVVVCMGAPARWQLGGIHLPVEAAGMAIVDRCEVARSALERNRPFRWLGPQAPRGVP